MRYHTINIRKRPLKLDEISVVDFSFPHTIIGFLKRAHQRQSKAKKCEIVVLLGRSYGKPNGSKIHRLEAYVQDDRTLRSMRQNVTF